MFSLQKKEVEHGVWKDHLQFREFDVLLVDDDPIARTINKLMLSGLESVEVYQAANGQEAIDFHRAGASFDLILMDLDLPVKNGYEVRN